MKLVAWNCRGLGNRPAVRGLLDVQKREDPDVLFLSETKLDEKRMRKFKWMLGVANMVVQQSDGKSDGLTLLWKRSIVVDLHNMSQYHIDAEIAEQDGFRWRFTGIYGESHSDQKEKTWRSMRNLNAQMRMSWLCAGDFNEILYGYEKQGGQPRVQACLDRFREALEVCGVQDLGFEGDRFTWRNHCHPADRYVRERLDRAVASQNWCRRFPMFHVINGDPRHSDHRPVIVLIKGIVEVRSSGFEARWLEEEACG